MSSCAGVAPIKASNITLSTKPGVKKLNIETDEEGNIKYPIIVHQSLKILDLGYIEYERPSYHTATNIFPIGFKSIRVHHSAKSVGGRAEYTCEILDGGEKP